MTEKERQVSFRMNAAEYIQFKKLCLDEQTSIKERLIEMIRREIQNHNEKEISKA